MTLQHFEVQDRHGSALQFDHDVIASAAAPSPPPAATSAALPNGMQRLASGFGFNHQGLHDGSSDVYEVAPSPPAAAHHSHLYHRSTATVSPSASTSSQSTTLLPLPTYNTSYSRILAFERKLRRRKLARKEEAEEQRKLEELLSGPNPQVEEDLNDRAKASLSVHDDVDVSEDRQPMTTASHPLAQCRAMIRRGQLLQGMTLLMRVLQENANVQSYLPLSSDSDSPSVLISPLDTAAIAADIGRIFSSNIQLDHGDILDDGGKPPSPSSSSPPPLLPLWRPAILPTDISPVDLPKGVLCSHALATLFDGTIALGYDPPQAVSAILLSCFSQSMPQECYLGAVELIIELYGLEEIGMGVLSAMIVGYARVGMAETSERLLEDFARCHAHACGGQLHHISFSAGSAAPPPLNGWSRDGAIWSSLIRASVIANDIPGAYRWLNLFRAVRDGEVPLDMRPLASPTPYLTLMSGLEWHAIRRRVDEGGDAAGDAGTDPAPDAQIIQVVRTMRADGVEPSAQVLNFMAKFARKRRNVEGAVEALREVAGSRRRVATTAAETVDVDGEVTSTDKQPRPLSPTSPPTPPPEDLHHRTALATAIAHRLLSNGRDATPSTTTITVGRNWDAHTLQELFDVLKYAAGDAAAADGTLNAKRTTLAVSSVHAALPLRPRTVFQTMLALHLNFTNGVASATSPYLTTPTLYKALRCALDARYRDYPLALAVVQAFRLCNLEADTHRLLLMIVRSVEVEVGELEKRLSVGGEDVGGDPTSPVFTAHLAAAGVDEVSGRLSEWEWRGMRGARGGHPRQENSVEQVPDNALPTDGAELDDPSHATPPHRQLKMQSLVSLKNLLRWSIFHRIHCSVRGGGGGGDDEGPKWDWTVSGSVDDVDGVRTLHEQFASFRRERGRKRLPNHSLPSLSMAGTTAHEWQLSRAALDNVWRGCFDLCGEELRGRFTWSWDEDEIVRVRVKRSRGGGGGGGAESRAKAKVSTATDGNAVPKRGRGRPRKNVAAEERSF